MVFYKCTACDERVSTEGFTTLGELTKIGLRDIVFVDACNVPRSMVQIVLEIRPCLRITDAETSYNF